jgi:hypothetical protein
MELRPGLRVLLTSGYATAESPDPAASPLPLLRKPYRRTELAAQLRTALRPPREVPSHLDGVRVEFQTGISSRPSWRMPFNSQDAAPPCAPRMRESSAM